MRLSGQRRVFPDYIRITVQDAIYNRAAGQPGLGEQFKLC